MYFLTMLPLLFLLSVIQVSILMPLFASLILSPHISLLFLWIYGKNSGDRTLITTAFFLGLFFDAISNTWGAYTFTTVLFTYIYTFLRTALIVKKETYEVFFIIPVLLIVYKLFLFPLIKLKADVEFSIKEFGISLLIEYLFIFFFYKLKKK